MKDPCLAKLIQDSHNRTKVATILTLMVIWTALGSIFALLLGYSRIPYAAAIDGNFFKIFARLHPTKDFPHVSLVFITALSVACAYLPLLQVIDWLLVTRIIVQFVGQTFALITLRKRFPNAARPYKMPLYPLPAIIALAGWAFVFCTYPLKTIAYGLGMLGLGLLAYPLWRAFTGARKIT